MRQALCREIHRAATHRPGPELSGVDLLGRPRPRSARRRRRSCVCARRWQKDCTMEHHDIRMRGFTTRHDVDAALALLEQRISPLPSEVIPLDEGLDRVLAQDIVAAVDVPHFDRSAVDGYGVRARDTFGASDYNPIPLALRGEVF